MSDRDFCASHSIFYSGNSCPRCDAERRHEDLLSTLEESAESFAIRGEYECPHCKYLSVKSGASRCPLCHGTIDAMYWSAVRAREAEALARKRALREEQAAAVKRDAPARAVAELQRARADFRKRWAGYALASVWYGYLLGGFGGCVGRVLVMDMHDPQVEALWPIAAFFTLGPMLAVTAPICVALFACFRYGSLSARTVHESE